MSMSTKQAIIACAKKIAKLEIELETLMGQEDNSCASKGDAGSGDQSSDIERCRALIAHHKAEMDTLLKRYIDKAVSGVWAERIMVGRIRGFIMDECIMMAKWLRTHYMGCGNDSQKSLWDMYVADNPV